MTASPIQTGLLAYGMSGQIFQAPFVAAHPGFALRAVTERHQQRAAQDYPTIQSYPSVEALLADPELELVIVNTPSNTHVDLATQALLAGKHVLVEKPVAITTPELEGLLELAQRQGRHFLAYQNRRWDSDFQAVRAVVESGQLGKLHEVHFRYDRFRTPLNAKKFKEEPGPGAGLFYDLGPHLLDQAISLFGAPLSCTKTLTSHRPYSRVDDYFHLHLRYPEGLEVFLTSGLLVAQPSPAFVLHGTRGSFSKMRSDAQEAQLQAGMRPTEPGYGQEAPEHAGRLTLAAPGTDNLTTTSYPGLTSNYLELFEAVFQTIRHDAPYPIRKEQLLQQLALLEQPAS
ncbi:oxidoreductase [Hymenobacter sp. NBH84]|uniref:Gfo/Idh/MocA family oxidoreductase n=1 Tax=Hymenobacter sp. NBH84 TaxID=2596915 RepID=UPI001624C0E6|nr:Gfo/Idh/MocA family oxidoreductase [Hymenobacter sp. NBH84]QNE41337.1 oxidoreductase [Hymenobacter sp. NBH84]